MIVPAKGCTERIASRSRYQGRHPCKRLGRVFHFWGSGARAMPQKGKMEGRTRNDGALEMRGPAGRHGKTSAAGLGVAWLYTDGDSQRRGSFPSGPGWMREKDCDRTRPVAVPEHGEKSCFSQLNLPVRFDAMTWTRGRILEARGKCRAAPPSKQHSSTVVAVAGDPAGRPPPAT